MGFASDMQEVANDLLGEFDESLGRIALVKVGGDPVWNETLGEMVIPASSDIPLIGVTVAFSAAQINGATIQQGDVMCIVQALDPSVGVSLQDKVKIGGVQWSIVDTPLVDYTGLTICHKIHCRK
jgi:hypothetical protein